MAPEETAARKHGEALALAMARTPVAACTALVLLTALHCPHAYEKTLRKIVRNQSKMVQRAFSETDRATSRRQIVGDTKILYSGFAQRWPLFRGVRPAQSPAAGRLGAGGGPRRGASEARADARAASAFFLDDSTPHGAVATPLDASGGATAAEPYRPAPVASIFFPPVEAAVDQSAEKKVFSKVNIKIPAEGDASSEANGSGAGPVPVPRGELSALGVTSADSSPDVVRPPFGYNATAASAAPLVCGSVAPLEADIDAQERFSRLDIEPTWMTKEIFWNAIFESRYVSLMRNPKWPPLKVVVVAVAGAAGGWAAPAGLALGPTAHALSGAVKKLRYYEELRFAWPELAQLSRWWAAAAGRTRATFRKLLKSGRLEITTGVWVEPDEATAHLFGLVHLLFEGHQWLKRHLKYRPSTAWLTSGVTHGPTMAYLLAASGIDRLVFANVHFAWEQFLAEYQHGDFVWVQEWDSGEPGPTALNRALGRMGRAMLPRHAALAHLLPLGGASGLGDEIAFRRNRHVTALNVRAEAERLLEQCSKAGTLSTHNVVLAPLSGPRAHRDSAEFDHQFNNYRKLAEFINANRDIYKATIQFGAPNDYFAEILQRQSDYPTLKGDFLNFADVKSGAPAYWAGAFTSRPFIKVLLRRLNAALRSAEILLTFAVGANVFGNEDFDAVSALLLKARETVASLADRHVASGTVSETVARHVQRLALSTTKDCRRVQEVASSLLSTASAGSKVPYLRAYVLRDGEFTTEFEAVSPGDQIYVFNSLGHERTEVVELVSSRPNLRVVDHNKKDLTVQVNPVWKYGADESIVISRKEFGVAFAVTVAPMALELFAVKEAALGPAVAAVFCSRCGPEEGPAPAGAPFPFELSPLRPGDVQLENYHYRLIFDEVTGFVKTLVEKETDSERVVSVDYGAFRASTAGAGTFVFRTSASKPVHDPLRPYRLGVKAKSTIVVSGPVASEITSVFGRLLRHSVKMYNLVHGYLSKSVFIRSGVDLEVSPENVDLELFLSVQTDVGNGHPPRLYTDNNGFQFTARYLNLSRRVESNVYPMTTMAFIEDERGRLTVVSDHAQGVTGLREGQLLLMLDRRVPHDDGRGAPEGLPAGAPATHTHVLLLERFSRSSAGLALPSAAAMRLSRALDSPVDVFVADRGRPGRARYAFLPMLKVAFPCDVSVVTYRLDVASGRSRNATPTAAFLILHRTAVSCRIPEARPEPCPADGAFRVRDVLHHAAVARRTNLPGTAEADTAARFDHSNFAPMELMTLRIHFS